MFCFVKVTFESDKFSFESRLSKETFQCERGLRAVKIRH